MTASKQIVTTIVATTMWLGLGLVVQGQEGRRNTEATAAYEQGVAALADEEYDAAVNAFTKAIEIDETYFEAYRGRGDALRKQEDYGGALQSYTNAINYGDDSADVYNGRGICYREGGSIELALNDFRNAYQKDRSNPEVAANLGDIFLNYLQDVNSALPVLERAAELDPKNNEVFRNLGLCHAYMRQFDQAEEDLRKAVELKDDDFKTYGIQANILLLQDKTEKLPAAIDALSNAIQYYEPTESTDPKIYADGYLSRADARLKLAIAPNTPESDRQQYYDLVLKDADTVLDEMPEGSSYSGRALYRKGLALRMQGAFGEAITALTDAIQLIPPGESSQYAGQAYWKRGICWHMQGENELARGDFEQAAAIDYTDPLPEFWIGITYAAQGEYRSAIDRYGEAISKGPNYAPAFINRGLAYAQLKEYDHALENFNEAIRIEPTNGDYHAKRGYAYMRMNEYEKAYNAFHMAEMRDVKDPAVFHATAEALRELGRSSLAEQYDARARDLESMTN